MKQDESLIIVTWDFTEKSFYGLEHAIQLSSVMDSSIALLHIVKKESEKNDALLRMKKSVNKKYGDSLQKLNYIVKSGTIFTTIGETVSETNAQLVIMATHGILGMQKLLGSWALKVIASAKAPFIVIQDAPGREVMNKILIPVNFRRETKECVSWAYFMAKNFGSKFVLFKAKHEDSKLRRGVESNLFFIRKFFANKGVVSETADAQGLHDFGKEAVNFAFQNDCNAIMIMTTRDIGFADYVLGPQEQYIIANGEKIPVICINPRPAKIGGGFSASGG